MKIPAVYLKIDLIKKPEWFVDFRKKYDESFDLHLTLIQPRQINNEQVDDLKNKMISFFKDLKFTKKDSKLFFDKPAFEKMPDGNFVCMLFAQKNEAIMNLQKELRMVFENYGNYYNEVNKDYEIDFKPHLTIGRNIKVDLKEEVEKYLFSYFDYEGLITDLVLPIVKDISVEEAKNPNNLLVFNLQQKFTGIN